MNIETGCKFAPDLEELLALLPGDNKDIYEDDAEELLETIARQEAMKPVAAWKELKVTAVREADLDLSGIALACPCLAGRVKEGDSVYGAVVTAGAELHKLLADCDDIMQEYILGFLMSEILVRKTVDVVEALTEETGLSHVEMIMVGIPEVCGMDQQVQIGKMLSPEFEAMNLSVKEGGSLTPVYSSTALFLLSPENPNIPGVWGDSRERKSFGEKLFKSAGHS